MNLNHQKIWLGYQKGGELPLRFRYWGLQVLPCLPVSSVPALNGGWQGEVSDLYFPSLSQNPGQACGKADCIRKGKERSIKNGHFLEIPGILFTESVWQGLVRRWLIIAIVWAAVWEFLLKRFGRNVVCICLQSWAHCIASEDLCGQLPQSHNPLLSLWVCSSWF